MQRFRLNITLKVYNMKHYFIFFIIMVLSCTGCALFETKEEKSAQELASDGLKAFEKKRYPEAIEAYKKLKDWYPFDKNALVAELKIADAHYELKEYDEAILAYEEFENLHPRNEKVSYVIFQIGRCYYAQMDSVDRDQTPVKKALDTFKRLTKQFPEHSYAQKAEDLINECYKSLAGHELYVARFQYKTKKYKGALARLNGVISDYPDVGTHQEAQLYISLCKAALKRQELDKK